MKNIKYILILIAIFSLTHLELSTTPILPSSHISENIYIRIFSNTSGFITGGETIAGEGDNWFQLMEVSGGYYHEIDENGLLIGQVNQYNTSVLIQQKDALTSLLTDPLVQNHSLEVEIIIMELDNVGASQVRFKYVLSNAQLLLMQNFNSSDFEVKTIRLDFISEMVEQSDEIFGIVTMLSF